MDLDILFNDHELYHSELQQDCFITKKSGGTIYGQYKQALRELYKRYRGLKGLYFQKKELELDEEDCNANFELIADEPMTTKIYIEMRRIDISKAKIKFNLLELNKNIKETEREFKRFYQQAISLKKIIGELTEEKRRNLDKEMWIYKLKEMCAIDFIVSNRLRQNTVEMIHSLDSKDRKKILSEVRDHESLLEWYENKDQKYELLDVNIDFQKLLS